MHNLKITLSLPPSSSSSLLPHLLLLPSGILGLPLHPLSSTMTGDASLLSVALKVELATQPISRRYRIPAGYSDLSGATTGERDGFVRRGVLFLDVVLLELLQIKLLVASCFAVQPWLGVLFRELRDAFTSSAGFMDALGSMATLKTYDEVFEFTSKPLHQLLESLGGVISNLPPMLIIYPGISPLTEAECDETHRILLRLRTFSDAEEPRPARMSDLRPFVPGNGIALSKLGPAERERRMVMAARMAEGDLASFFLDIWEKEVLTDGFYPCSILKLPEEAWRTLLDREVSSRDYNVRLGRAVLRLFTTELCREKLIRAGAEPGPDVYVVETLTNTILSTESLTLLLFRLGVYQNRPDCPYDGMSSEYPADAFSMFCAMVHLTAPAGRRGEAMRKAVNGWFAMSLQMLATAYVVFKLHPYNSSIEQPRVRRVLAPTQDRISASPPSSPPRKEKPAHNRTTVPRIRAVGTLTQRAVDSTATTNIL
ncbi:hypothetical protein FB451DRAFT_1559469 [Mycena latifolia]|nr:hypothetical protein FB451DRAFT_1559469 [Mycena latifolia]